MARDAPAHSTRHEPPHVFGALAHGRHALRLHTADAGAGRILGGGTVDVEFSEEDAPGRSTTKEQHSDLRNEATRIESKIQVNAGATGPALPKISCTYSPGPPLGTTLWKARQAQQSTGWSGSAGVAFDALGRRTLNHYMLCNTACNRRPLCNMLNPPCTTS